MTTKEQKIKSAVKELEKLAKWMDDYHFDVIIGLIPGAGDFASYLISVIYTHKVLKKHGLHKAYFTKMLTNLTVDFIIGLVPAIGDLIDFLYKANRRNVDLLKKEQKEN
ncbi:DUF4112 domain-containing protein [Sediminitomix flava]|uniref:Uncharacterized protein DUF4112 n=1 Tax=Sediminitomix flava TaxID=379075 RepID=A0A315ZCQ3_SEDFL|nr:DUF4112 domain-containing protein [Sediminitomix flava]PWJ43356.1 uncharacterized protein DUF4112 [Sediminitomix flava]